MAYIKKNTYAPLPQTTRGFSLKIDCDPKGKSFLYTNGRSVFIRDLANPAFATEYVGHNAQATVARFSPSGFYAASGDVHGNVRIWDTINEEHILKSECRPISGRINDIAWDFESKRLIAVGDGKERFGHAFLFDTLSSAGQISGHNKVINSVSIRHKRPFRAATASDDMSVVFHHGVPFKYGKTIRDHTRFIHAVQFSPNGDLLATAGADGKIFIYDGSTGDLHHELQGGHDSKSVFSVAWSPDSTQLLTSSADGTARIWDVQTSKVVSTYDFSSTATSNVDCQQVGNAWQGDWLLSASLSGEIHYLDKSSGKISRTLDGHSKAITSMAVTSSRTLLTGSYDGRVFSWPFGTEHEDMEPKKIQGNGHSNQITALAVNEAQDAFVSSAMDDTVRLGSLSKEAYKDIQSTTGNLPRSVAASPQHVVIATTEHLQVYNSDLQLKSSLDKPGYEPSVVDIDPKDKYVVAGSKTTNKVYVYQLAQDQLSLVHEVASPSGYVSAIAVHPSEDLVAVGDSVGKIFLYQLSTGEVVHSRWVFHTSRICSLAWSKCGAYLASAGLDTHIYVWSKDKPSSRVVIKNAHADGVNAVRCAGPKDGKLVVFSAGQDAATRLWLVTPPQ